MKDIKKGEPLTNKKALSFEDVVSDDITHCTLKLPKELHKKIMLEKINNGGNIQDIIMKVLEERFK